MSTTAERDGDEYVIDGEKYWIGNGVEADWVTLYARTGDDPNTRYGNFPSFVSPRTAGTTRPSTSRRRRRCRPPSRLTSTPTASGAPRRT